MTIGERISTVRKAQHISQADLAKMLDVSRQAVSKWENDLTAPDTINLIRLADALDTDVEFLATGNHSVGPAQVVTVVEKVEVPVERVIEKSVPVEKIVEKERIVEKVVEIPVIKRVYRVRYVRNPLELAAVGLVCLFVGFVIGLIL